MEIKDYKPLNFKITVQGGPILNNGWILAESDNVVAARIDLETKWAEIDAYSSDENNVPGLYLRCNCNSLHVKNGLEEELTGIYFSDYPNFDCICANISKYTLSLCLVKRENENHKQNF